VEIARVDSDGITLRQPLRFDLRAEWAPRIVVIDDLIEESGVVGMSLVMQRIEPYVSSEDHHHEAGWNGVYLENAWNCFAQDIEVIDSESGILVTSSKHVTVRDFVISNSSAELAPQHHGTIARMYSNDLLFEDFTIESAPIHGVNVESFSMGNVWSRGTLNHGTWDVHRGMPIENVVTELVMFNDGGTGGRADAGPRAGARHAVWNVQVSNDDCTVVGEPARMPNGAIVGLRGCVVGDPGIGECLVIDSGLTSVVVDPPNLYEAQRALRMCESTR
jgi:hypothetical protein